MALSESVYAVWLGEERVGTIYQRGDHTRFNFTEDYRANPHRPVLGLAFEQDLSVSHTAALRLPRWFSNLLPEGQLRQWIADDRRVSSDREMELLAQVGHDLPGAVRVLPSDEPGPSGWAPDTSLQELGASSTVEAASRWRFSLAGVGLKFSMVADGERLALPPSAKLATGSSNSQTSSTAMFPGTSSR